MANFIENSRGSTSPTIGYYADLLGEAIRMNTRVELPYGKLSSIWSFERRLGLQKEKDRRQCVDELSR